MHVSEAAPDQQLRQDEQASLDVKAQRLQDILRECGRVAIAFSGGVDSSLLLKYAIDTLGAANVLALFAHSELLTAEEVDRVAGWPAANGCGEAFAIEQVLLDPLEWPEFVSNDPERCYRCKRRIYTAFCERMQARGMSCLVDGTNTDDLRSHRPGLRALHELGIRMPLAEAGLNKGEVRQLSRRLGLAGWDRPAASCLATRIPEGMAIARPLLRRIEVLEAGLRQLGLQGCRVRVQPNHHDLIHLEIQAGDFFHLADAEFRQAIYETCSRHGVVQILLNLTGRSG